ncbi:hypothetical protein SAMN04490197_2964 [Pseudomonas orientalis]|uniref:Uncharacterized protein n=1 Tax=Pseudomonas orientalis TaxID=76758 RepID=A0A8B3XYU5_9PSED|nr:hypothetical protein SAMN04490197_2964 [Pseudomonas orientalis]
MVLFIPNKVNEDEAFNNNNNGITSCPHCACIQRAYQSQKSLSNYNVFKNR